MDPSLKRNGFSWLLVISLAFNLAFIVSYAVSKHCPSRASMASMGPGHRASEGLCARMGSCGQRMKGKIKALEDQLVQERKALTDLLTAPEVDQARLAAQVGKITSIQAQVQMAVLETLLEERARLGPDKRSDFDSMLRTCMHAPGGPAGKPGCEGME